MDTRLGRYHVAEPLTTLATLHRHNGTSLKTVDHEPPLAALDQEDLIAQGIDTSQLVPGAKKVVALGSCFPAGTRVRMADGTERRIEEVQRGDEVVTAEVRTGRVTETQTREARGLVSIKLWGHSHLRCTPEHPILTSRGYVAAADLTRGDEIALPRYMAQGTAAVTTRDLIELPQAKCAKQIPEKIALNDATGFLFGAFLAEGSVDSSKVRWIFGTHEAGRAMLARTLDLLLSEWGETPHVRETERHTHVVTMYGTAWARLFAELCGHGGPQHKRPHALFLSGPSEFQRAMFSGWEAGDGNLEPRSQRRTITTVSRDLALSMFDIAQALGLRPALITLPGSVNGSAARRLPRWDVKISHHAADAAVSNYSRQDTAHVWRRVRAIEMEEFEGTVYNLEVAGDHSYVAEGIGVHNCVFNASTAHLSGLLDETRFGTLIGAAHDPYKDTKTAEEFAIRLYHATSDLTGDPSSEWPPTDCGSSGIYACKELQARGVIGSYKTAVSPTDLVSLLQAGSVIVGSPWFQAWFDPDRHGFVDGNGSRDALEAAVQSGVAGGHETCISAVEKLALTATGTVEPAKTVLRVRNSWSGSWGDAGSYRIHLSTWAALAHVVDYRQMQL